MEGLVVPAAGLLLTGGASSRLGRDKARLVIAGKGLAQMTAEKMSSVLTPVVEVGPGVSGLPHLSEEGPGRGPLAALASGWEMLAGAGHEGPALCVACDLFGLTTGLLRLLACWPGGESVVPVVDGRCQLLCARWSARALGASRELVDSGRFAVKGLLSAGPTTFLHEPAWVPVATKETFRDIDTPEDLEAALGRSCSEDPIQDDPGEIEGSLPR